MPSPKNKPLRRQSDDNEDAVARALKECTGALQHLSETGQRRVIAGLQAWVNTPTGING